MGATVSATSRWISLGFSWIPLTYADGSSSIPAELAPVTRSGGSVVSWPVVTMEAEYQ